MPRRGYRRIQKKDGDTTSTQKIYKPNVWRQDNDKISDQKMVERHNLDFVDYYKRQKIIYEDEWDTFYETLRTELPTTFRIVEGTMHTDYLISEIQKAEMNSGGLIKRLEWYPGHAYELNVSRAILRSSEILKEFHQFLVKQSEAGSLFRQEAVSMVPALFFDLKADSKVLDMCASPGSKTSQLIEFLHKAAGDSTVPKGVVVANDSNSQRGHMLIHHLRHLDSPSLIVTNHFSEAFPNVFVQSDCCLQQLKYTHVLCDVPCTGDGTLRKAKVLWKEWEPSRALGLHKLQLNILKRGLELLEIGGTLVYSTCSLNPLENEAVVNAALVSCGHGIVLVNVSDSYRSLKRNEGLLQWSVYWKSQWMSDISEAPIKGKGRKMISASMFPQYRSEGLDVSAMGLVDLKKCLRFHPHVNNTGGFFVAVLQKISHFRWIKGFDPRVFPNDDIEEFTDKKALDDDIDDQEIMKDEDANDSESIAVSSDDNIRLEDRPFVSQSDFMSFHDLEQRSTRCSKHQFWDTLGERYGFKRPKDYWHQFFVKYESIDMPKRVWFASEKAAEIVNGKFRSPLKIQSCGSIMFEGRHSDHFRLTCFGSQWLSFLNKQPLPSLDSPQVAVVDPRELLEILEENGNPRDQSKYRHRIDDTSSLKRLVPERPCIIVCQFNSAKYHAISGWRGRSNIELMIDTETRFALAKFIFKESDWCTSKLHSTQYRKYFTLPVPKSLNEIVKLPLFTKEPPEVMQNLWLTQFKEKEDIVADVIPSTEGKLLLANIRHSPQFIVPIFQAKFSGSQKNRTTPKCPENVSHFNLFLQFQNHKLGLMTSLDSYRLRPEGSPPFIILSFFDELIESKNLLFVRIDSIAKQFIGKEELNYTLDFIRTFYTSDSLYKNWVNVFNHQSRDFDFHDFMNKTGPLRTQMFYSAMIQQQQQQQQQQIEKPVEFTF